MPTRTRYELLLHSGRIYSMEREGECFSAMAIGNGKVQKLFDRDPPSAIARKSVDLQGRAVLPGLIDSHAHFMATAAMAAVGISCYEIQAGRITPDTLDGIRRRVVALAQNRHPRKPLLCNNYVVSSIKEDRLPYREEIDAWLPGRVAVFLTIDGHAGAYSSAALVKMGIDPKSSNGIFTGKAHQKNIEKFNRLILGTMDLKTILKGMAATANDALDYGLTGIHCLEGFSNSANDQALKLFTLVAPRLPLQLRLYPQIRSVETASKLFSRMRKPRIGGCGAWAIDGAVGARTAAFYTPYKGEENRGNLFNSDEKIAGDIFRANQKGCQITAHVIGTRGIDQLVKAYADLGATANPLRHRVDHFEFPTVNAVEKAVAQAKLIIVPQPGFFWMDERIEGMGTYRKYLDSETIKRALPLKTIQRMGGIICGSSDAPVQPLNPFLQIHGMVNYPIEAERLSLYEALRTYTYNGAWATFEENSRGTLKAGKSADFIIMQQNPFEIATENILNLQVSSTWINGRKMSPVKLSPARLPGLLLFNKGRKI